MKFSIAMLTALALNGSVVFGEASTTKYNVVTLTEGEGSETDISQSGLKFEVITSGFERRFVLTSDCRTISGKLVSTKIAESAFSTLEVRIDKTLDNCSGTSGDLMNLRAFMRLSMAKTLVQGADEIQLVNSAGNGVVMKQEHLTEVASAVTAPVRSE